MADTIRTEAELITIFHDNTTGDITAQNARDFVVSTLNKKPAADSDNTIVASVDNVAGLTIQAYDGSGNLIVGKFDGSTTTFTVDGSGNVACKGLTVTQGTLGNAVQTLTSTATNDDPVEIVYQSRLATTNGTLTTLASIPATIGYTYRANVVIVARRTSGTGTDGDSGSWELKGTYTKPDATGRIVGTLYKVADKDISGWDATMTAATDVIQVDVTGAAGTNITWHMTARIYKIGT